jgi:hypothetical protein
MLIGLWNASYASAVPLFKTGVNRASSEVHMVIVEALSSCEPVIRGAARPLARRVLPVC